MYWQMMNSRWFWLRWQMNMGLSPTLQQRRSMYQLLGAASEWLLSVAKPQYMAAHTKGLPRILIKSVVQECTIKLNFVQVKGSCSAEFSPRAILHEVNLSFEQCKVPQLAYVLAHNEPIPLNSTQPRAIDGIYMRSVSNAQGIHEVLNLATNEVILRRR
jgi:hypothetical protein